MALPVSFFSETKTDNTLNQKTGNGESANWRVAVTTITAANLVAMTANITSLAGAVAAITLGRTVHQQTEVNVFDQARIPATDPLAQRENKWLGRYHDATNGQKFSVSWPTADVSLHMTNSEFLDLTAGDGAALKAAFEAIVVSPNDSSHATILDSVQFVGRNT